MSRTRASIIETAPWSYEGWLTARDIITAGKLACCLIVAITPERYWPVAAKLMAQAHLRLRSGGTHLLQSAQGVLKRDAYSVVQDAVAADYLFNIQAIREGLPGRWQGELRLVRREILDAALQRCRGAVLWYGPFVGSPLLMEKALAGAGYGLTRLGSPYHPFSATRLGGLFLNAPRMRAENRYLTRRVLVVYGKARSALEVLRQVLGENGVVVVRAIGAGRRTLSFPFLGGTMDLAIGAPRLAYETGAALIPVFMVGDNDGQYRIEIGQEITPLTDLPEDRALRQMAALYVEQLEPVVRGYPARWEGWFHPETWRPLP